VRALAAVTEMFKRGLIRTTLSVATGAVVTLAPAAAGAAVYAQARGSVAAAPADSASAWQPWYLSPKFNEMWDLAAFGRDDIWAVGAPGDYSLHPMVLRWDGAKWRTVTVPGSAGYRTTEVDGSSANDVWVFGETQTQAEAFRWDGTRWHKISVPREGILGDPVVLSATNVWAVGENTCSIPSKHGAWKCTTHLLHWNGRAWATTSISESVEAVAASAAGTVWAVGIAPHGNDVGPISAYRWTGKRWAAVTMPHPQAGDGPGIAVDSAGHVWIGATVGNVAKDYVLHWTGTQWEKIPLSPNVAETVSGAPVTPDGHGGVWYGWWAHWTGGAWINTDVFAPPLSNLTVTRLVKIPGMSGSFAGSAYSGIPSDYHAAVVVYGQIP
jgi:hypothetical protein